MSMLAATGKHCCTLVNTEELLALIHDEVLEEDDYLRKKNLLFDGYTILQNFFYRITEQRKFISGQSYFQAV